MDLKEKNWQNFVNNSCELHGIWVGYTPQKKLFGSFQMTRGFLSNKEKTEITHFNRYIFNDGKTEDKSWQVTKSNSNLDDGIAHPESPLMRTYFFENGANASAIKQLKNDSFYRIQLSFTHKNLSSSVVVFYDDSSSLMRAVVMRLDSTGFPSKYWSTDINLLTDKNISGNWQGTSVTMTPDLKVSSPVPTQLHWDIAGNETFFFPDGISLSCPGKVSIGTDITIAANWLVTPSQLQQLIVKYNNVGAFASLTLELFHKSDEAEILHHQDLGSDATHSEDGALAKHNAPYRKSFVD